MNLGENIYRLRTDRNLSQGDLADALCVSRQSVSKWENNSAVPELDKLMKMAQIFEITLDELVTGAQKEKPDAPTPPPQSAAAESPFVRQGLSPQQIVGIALLTFGGLSLIVFTVVGIFVGMWLIGLAIAMPFLLCGIICLVCRKNVGLKCSWAVYLPIWFICNFLLIRRYGAMAYIVGGGLLLTGIILVFITLWRMKTGRIHLPRWAKLLISVAMLLMLVISVLYIIPPSQADVTNTPVIEDTIIAPMK